MRPIREHPPQRHLTGTCADETWAAAPCTDLDIAFLWDLEIDGNGAWAPAETKAQQRQRHEDAKAMCLDCPALALCQALPTKGRTGVIAGRVIRGKKGAA